MDYDVRNFENSESIKAYCDKINALNVEMTKRFENLKEKMKKDIKDIDKTKLVEEQNYNISLLQNYTSRLGDERCVYNKIKAGANSIETQLNDYYRFHWDKSTKLSETAITKYAANHPCCVAVTAYLKMSETIVKLNEDIITILRDRNYYYRNMIDIQKMEMGL